MKKYLIAVALLASTIVPAAHLRADGTEACSAETATMRPIDVAAGVPIEIVGSQVTRTEMARLWEITTTRRDAWVYLGKIIGAGQNWLGACEYPGLGISTGSGWGIADYKTVVLWVWAAGVDITVARESVYSLITDVVPTTTTAAPTTTTTTMAPTTTIAAPTTTTVPATTTTEYVAPANVYAATAFAVAAMSQFSGTVATAAPPAARAAFVAPNTTKVKAIPKKKAKKDGQRSRSRKRVCKARWVSCR